MHRPSESQERPSPIRASAPPVFFDAVWFAWKHISTHGLSVFLARESDGVEIVVIPSVAAVVHRPRRLRVLALDHPSKFFSHVPPPIESFSSCSLALHFARPAHSHVLLPR